MREDLMKVPLEELQEMLVVESQRGSIKKIKTQIVREKSNLKETFYSLLSNNNSEPSTQNDKYELVSHSY